MSFDLILRGGLVIDGLGTDARPADVGIADGRIAAIGRLENVQARAEIPVGRRCVAPGFIDPLSHSYYTLLVDPVGTSKVLQGVTLEVLGENLGAAPVVGPARAWVQESGLRDLGLELDWSTSSEYLRTLGHRGLGVNVGLSVPGGLLRACVAEPHDSRPLCAEALERAERHLEDALEHGAVGITFTLSEWPAAHFTTRELERLCRITARHDGRASFHLRSESDGLLDAVGEVLRLGRETGVRLEIVHFKALGRGAREQLAAAVEAIECALSEGVRIGANAYPYSTVALALQELVPGGAEIEPGALRRRLRDDPAFLAASVEALRHPRLFEDWDGVRPADARRCGDGESSLAALARQRGVPCWRVALELLQEAEEWIHCQCEFVAPESLRLVFSREWVSVCSDGSARDPANDVLRRGPVHPRDYGAFPRVLRWLVREERLLGLEEAVERMTRLSAERLGFPGRGTVTQGSAADLVVFDPRTVSDRATVDRPHEVPTGIDHVFVNGVAAVRDGRVCAARSGRYVPRES